MPTRITESSSSRGPPRGRARPEPVPHTLLRGRSRPSARACGGAGPTTSRGGGGGVRRAVGVRRELSVGGHKVWCVDEVLEGSATGGLRAEPDPWDEREDEPAAYE